MYIPMWESIADALARVVVTGLEWEQAKQQICAAIADAAIPVRVEIDKTERDVPGIIRTGQGQVKPPIRLRPDELDWVGSKPREAWATGPDPVEHYSARWGWRPRRIARLELWTDAVIGIFCSAAGSGAGTVPTPLALHAVEKPREGLTETLHPAPFERIRGAVGYVYRHAQQQGMKPPNLKEIVKPVQQHLRRDRYCASGNRIQEIASQKPFTVARRKPGPRVNRTLLPFSLEGWEKSGLES